MRVHPTADVAALREGIAADLAHVAAPLLERLETVDALIADRLDDLTALRAARFEITRAIRPIIGEDAIPLEPGRKAKPGPGKTKPMKKGNSAVAESRVDDTLAWLRESVNGNSFTVKDVQGHIGLSEASASAIVRRLVEREQIRFDGTGAAGIRVYRLVQ